MVFALNGRDTGDVQVPDVTNLTENSARNKLQAAGLEVGEISHKHSDSIDAGK